MQNNKSKLEKQDTCFYSIDSLRLRISLSKVKIISDDFNKIIAEINTENGNIISEKVLDHIRSDNQIPTSFKIQKQITSEQKVETFLTVAVSSKHLRERYFEGITKSNIEKVYKSILNEKIIDISYKDFIESELTDTDLKKDLSNIDYNKILEYVKQRAKASSSYGTGIRVFNKKTNQGFQFSDRKTSTNANPYFKLYNKNLQMRVPKDFGGMSEFADEYLEIPNGSLYRAEFTIKNKKMFDYYNLPNRLDHLLLIEPAYFSEVATKMMDKHLHRNKIIRETKNTSTDDIAIELLIDCYYNLGMNVDDLINDFENRIEVDRTFRRKKERILEIYEKVKTDETEKIDNCKEEFDKILS